jgi:LuxR family transcriptional regulator, regulator of acetate metabolism
MSIRIAPVVRPDRALDAAVRRRGVLHRELAGALELARRYASIGSGALDDGFDGADAVVEAAVAGLLGRLQGEQPGLTGDQIVEVCQLAVQLQRLGGQVRQLSVDRARVALGAIGRIVDEPVGESLDDRLRRAARELVDMAGFDRTLMLRLSDRRMEAFATHFRANEDWARECHQHALRHPVPLGPGVLEWEVVRRRRPALMVDPMRDPRAWAPMVHKYAPTSYASSPIVVDGETVAVIQADMYFAGRDVDEVDRDILAAHAAGLGRDLERVVLTDRLHAQRDAVRHLVRATDAAVTEFSEADLWRALTAGSAPPAGEASVAAPRARDVGLDLLTRREREVLACLATGATNAAIATQLIVSEHTVKSHVEHILDKLGVANRAEAVARAAGIRRETQA